MPSFSKAELSAALAAYTAVIEVCTASGDWAPFADLFTEDCVYTEHAYGVFEGREAVRTWIVDVMRPFPHMRFPTDWVAYDEDNGKLLWTGVLPGPSRGVPVAATRRDCPCASTTSNGPTVHAYR